MENEPRIGDWLPGKYQIKEILGRGAMGCVYKAWHETSDIDVAIKLVPREVTRVTRAMEEIRENFRKVQGLKHPNIAAVNHLEKIENADGTVEYFLVMEYVPGMTLDAYRRSFEDGKIPVEEASRIAGKIAAGLDFAHQKRIMHRDVKPENIMITPSGEVKILDFGLAMQIRTTAARVSGTVKYSLAGSYPYMAPEQWLGQKQDGQTDIYALGAVFYEMVQGRPPFLIADAKIMMDNALKQPPPPIPNVSRCVNKVVAKALSKKRKNRHGKASRFAQRIEECLNRKIRVATLVAAALGAAILVCGGLLLYQNQEEEKKQKEILARRGDVQSKLETITPEDIVGNSQMSDYARAVALLARDTAKDLHRKGLLDGHTVAITGFRKAEGEGVCPPLTISLQKRVGNYLFKLQSLTGADLKAAPREHVETIEDEIIYSGDKELRIDLDGIRHFAVPDILITGTWLNGKKDWLLTIRAYKRRPPPAVGCSGKKGFEVFTIETSNGMDVPKEESLRAELLDCIENTDKTPSTPIVRSSISAGMVHMKSSPAGSTVHLDGREMGKTPISLKNLTEGSHTFEVSRPGYRIWTDKIEIVAGDELTFDPTLVPEKAGLKIESEPSGASVSLDGEKKGETTLILDDIEPGERRIAVSLPDHETWKETIAFGPGEKLERMAVLVPIDRFSAEKKQALEHYDRIMASFGKGDLEPAREDLERHGEFLATYLEDGRKKLQAKGLARFFRYYNEARSAAGQIPATVESLGTAVEQFKEAQNVLKEIPGSNEADRRVSRLYQEALAAKNKLEAADDAYRQIVTLTNERDWPKARSVLKNKKPELAENLDSLRFGYLEELEKFWERMDSAENLADKSDKASLEKAVSEFGEAKRIADRKLPEEIVLSKGVQKRIDEVREKLAALARKEEEKKRKETRTPSGERFVKNPDGTIRDNKLGLDWWPEDNGKDITYDQALEEIDKMNAQEDEGEWELPTRDELYSLYDKNAEERKVECSSAWYVKMATDMIHVTCWWFWASDKEPSGSRVGAVGLASGTRLFLHPSDSSDSRFLPVRRGN